MHQIYLLPGFFGFVNFGRLVYFTHVREFLEETLYRHGLEAEIHRVRVSPTASLRKRASEVASYIAETAPPRGPIHLVGHSTGGLDCRLLLTPGADLGIDLPLEPLAERVRSLVTVTSPHHGTPLASFFTGILGQKLLRLLSLITVEVLRNGRLPLRIVARLGAGLAKAALPNGRSEVVFDHLQDELLLSMPDRQRDYISAFFAQIGSDQALMPQLMPEGIDMFNASTQNRATVRYASVAARARVPGLKGRWRVGLGVYEQATYSLFQWLHYQTAVSAKACVPDYTEQQKQALRDGFGGIPGPRDNDGIVPTCSQVYGELIHCTEGDHLDVIGHFGDVKHVPPHHDWLPTSSNFTRTDFEALWTSVADFIARS
jgi:triacylglycerol lipase